MITNKPFYNVASKLKRYPVSDEVKAAVKEYYQYHGARAIRGIKCVEYHELNDVLIDDDGSKQYMYSDSDILIVRFTQPNGSKWISTVQYDGIQGDFFKKIKSNKHITELEAYKESDMAEQELIDWISEQNECAECEGCFNDTEYV